jgi:UDP-3-O-[3-hydroxymyristoyl] glucosamine N-acyltransferase
MGAVAGQRSLTVGEIAETLGAEILGSFEGTIDDVEILERAHSRHLTYIGDLKNLPRLKHSLALLIIAPPQLRAELMRIPDRTFFLVPQPEVAFLAIAALLRPRRERVGVGISDRAIVDPTAKIGLDTNVHPLAVVGADVVIGNNCDIHSGVVIGNGCCLGDHVVLYPNTVLYHDVVIGNHVNIHASCVIGSDGFGYRFVNGGHERLPHYGTVRICDDVEIGAGTTIDRAKVGETIVGSGTRIDNLVMIGHNCQIGRHNLLVGQVGLAGSVTTGDYVVCAGQVGIADHVHLGDGAVIGAKAGVHRDMPGGQTYLGLPAAPAAETARQMMALRRLPEIRDSVKKMEKELESLRARLADTTRVLPSENHDSAAA